MDSSRTWFLNSSKSSSRIPLEVASGIPKGVLSGTLGEFSSGIPPGVTSKIPSAKISPEVSSGVPYGISSANHP